ncbi:hypothetical protein PYCCODRAFT_452142 [Trametes coccinea BRFM310]|uniref:Uncharacterized protein n=1 Tax=Trametes coccinea (strain BRFM310) TaxID=1353009 RepID=A0A1Y2IL55_TRAC3|nr:hypothetical protein PYCCODRAFT_452142 [Trametes coccinea BRFM310]
MRRAVEIHGRDWASDLARAALSTSVAPALWSTVSLPSRNLPGLWPRSLVLCSITLLTPAISIDKQSCDTANLAPVACSTRARAMLVFFSARVDVHQEA